MDRIVIIDDEPAICASLKFAFEKEYETRSFTDPTEALDYIFNHEVAVVLLDVMLGKLNGLDLLREIKKRNHHSSVIMMTAFGSIEASVEAIKSGAFYYITKPINLKDLQPLVKRAVEFSELQEKVASLDLELQQKYEVNGIIGKSKKIKEVLEIIIKVKDIDSNVLITGESGTGKELVARAIHYSGKRNNSPFEVVNSAAIPHNLLESELFGYEKGAFTGAIKAVKGKFELAHGGTIFLDEIGEMDLALQAKVLRVIQEKEFRPLGSEVSRKVNVRILAATNRDLLECVQNNSFREDLYYRLNVIGISVPPLRERKEDIPLLIQHFLKKHSTLQHKKVKAISQEALRELLNYDYPGNIRELENIVERSVALSSEELIPAIYMQGKTETMVSVIVQGEEDEGLLSIQVGQSLREIEKIVILQTLEKVGGKQIEAAKILGITTRTLRNKLKEFNC